MSEPKRTKKIKLLLLIYEVEWVSWNIFAGLLGVASVFVGTKKNCIKYKIKKMLFAQMIKLNIKKRFFLLYGKNNNIWKIVYEIINQPTTII